MQQFPKTLRFYRQNPKTKEYYTFRTDCINDGLFKANLFHRFNDAQDRYRRTLKLNWELTEEQKFQADKIAQNPRGVIHMGTWKWKSWVIYNTVIMKKCRTLILCHNIQTANDMYKWLLQHTNISEKLVGLGHSKSKHPLTHVVDIMTHASFKKDYESLIGLYDCILYDECDFSLSFPKMYNYDCMVCALIRMDCNYMYWFTWTPYRADWGAEVLERIFWPIRSYEGDGAQYNFIPEITQVFSPFPFDDDEVEYEAFDDEIETRWDVVKNLVSNPIRTGTQLAFIKSHMRKWNMILVKSVDECNNIYRILSEPRLDWSMITNLVVLNGWLSTVKERESLALIDKAIKNDEWFTIVWTIDKLGRGVDIPPTDTLFLCSPIKFRGTVVQAVGRALRKYPGKTNALLFDWCDIPLLIKQQQERRASYKKEYWLEGRKIPIINIKPPKEVLENYDKFVMPVDLPF